jgi:ParB family chromosome partitioning protein
MTIAIQHIALSKLVPSSANVRRTGKNERVEELAASIAAHGLLQNLTVRPVENDRFEVIAGGRRLAALKLLSKQKLWAKTAPVPCQIIEGDNATEISLAENALQCPMHPADQYEAFAELHRQQMSIEDIAARFGVSPKIVMQRLKLGAVSPALIEEYRKGEMNLEQLSAFAITDDHALQERVWDELGFNKSRHAILEALNEGQVSSDDRRARYVGAETYIAAGGSVTRDLFDEEGGGFFSDTALLNRLVTEKLALEAEQVAAEGWKWVQVEIAFDHGLASGMRRIYPQTRELTECEQARIDELSGRYEAHCDEAEDHEPDALAQMLAEIDREIDAIRGEEAYQPQDRAIAGAFVTLGHKGEPRVERGFVRREDDHKRNATGEAGSNGETAKPAEGELPAKLVADLTAHRTAALANELALRPELALVAVTHALAGLLFYPRGDCLSCLDVRPHLVRLASHAKDIGESPAMRQLDERHAAWEKRMPDAPGDLWAFIVALTDADRLDLLAHCASLTLDAVQTPKSIVDAKTQRHADRLADALSLDMAAYWQPTASGFFARVPKSLVVKAVREGNCPELAQTLDGLKKPAMAERAEKLLAGKGWLPEVLRQAGA